MKRGQAEAFGGGLFLIGLGIIFLRQDLSFWPWILVALAVVELPNALFRPHRLYAWHSIIWLVGLALLFHFHIFWPGILFLVGASVIVHSLREPKKTRWGRQNNEDEA